ncbi:MAG: 6-phosphogluconolactonase [Chloroflexi bacterium]|nr:MAG: 6-phosphogluconolactonase [Chloroflexota bacterium]
MSIPSTSPRCGLQRWPTMPESLPGQVRIAANLAETVAAWLMDRAAAAIGDHGRFTLAVSGGSTPRPLYQLLAGEPWRTRADWQRWRIYFADERACPPDDPASNYRLIDETLLRQVPVDRDHIYRMEGEAPDPAAAAARYAELLVRTLPRGPCGAPRLDCILLGLGENGHTASLFPGQPALRVQDTWATRGRADYAPYDRITLTYATINAAAAVAFLVAGANKADALRGVLDGSVPAAGVAPREGELIWFLDEAAARSIAA